MISEVKCHIEIHQHLSTKILLIQTVSILQQRTLRQIECSNILDSLIRKGERSLSIYSRWLCRYRLIIFGRLDLLLVTWHDISHFLIFWKMFGFNNLIISNFTQNWGSNFKNFFKSLVVILFKI